MPIESTRAEAAKILREIVHCKKQLEAQWDSFSALTFAGPESPLSLASWRPLELAIELANDRFDSDNDIVSWFVWDNDCGEAGLQHSLPSGEMRAVMSVDDLLDVMGL